jgi:hypothetical protein
MVKDQATKHVQQAFLAQQTGGPKGRIPSSHRGLGAKATQQQNTMEAKAVQSIHFSRSIFFQRTTGRYEAAYKC